MNFLVIEDEEQAAKRLKRLLRKLEPDAFIHGPLEGVAETLKWIESNPSPDLIFLDIHLADGLSFEILEKVKIDAPIIFTTAYDQYAISAFKYNSVHYLLKPIEEEELRSALEKYHNAHLESLAPQQSTVLVEDMKSRFKKRFVSRIGDRIEIIRTEEIQFFYTENKGTYAKTLSGKDFLLDQPLEELENMLDPEIFFRLNRQYITQLGSVTEIRAYSNGRVRVELEG
jgi:DNA-binding LytR/AlgR family response regulator